MQPKCNKHDVPMRLTEVRDSPGKTVYVCDACDQERSERLSRMFPVMRSGIYG